MSSSILPLNPSPPRIASTTSKPLFDSKSIIQKIAQESFAELAVSAAIGSAVCLFTTTPLSCWMIFGAMITQIAINGIARWTAAYASYKKEEGGSDEKTYDWIAWGSNYICPITFSCFTATNGQVLIHETGHALAASVLHKQSHPLIRIHPWKNGMVFYNSRQLSSLGKYLGRQKSLLVIVLSGPALTLLVSTILLGVSIQMKKNSRLKAYLESVALNDFYNHFLYALSALRLSPLQLSHDFVLLASFKIHPIAAAVAIATIPIFFLISQKLI